MIKSKNYNVVIKYLVLFLLFFIYPSCGTQQVYISKIEGKKIAIADKLSQNQSIDDYIKPYRDKIDKDLSEILAYNPETLDKSGVWQTKIGDLLADMTMEYGNKIYFKRNNKNIDIILLNHGGIRSILPKGNLTMRNAYQIMPFENSLFIVDLNGEQILEMCQFIIDEKKPHPIAGLTFNIGVDKKPVNILIQGKSFEKDKIYSVGTSDYLSNGGDNMLFFKKNVGMQDMDYKLRNIFIDYLTAVDTVKVNKNIKISATY